MYYYQLGIKGKGEEDYLFDDINKNSDNGKQ